MKILSLILAAIPAVASILKVFERYFPAKTPVQRALENADKIREVRRENSRKVGEFIKEAKRGKTKAIEDILNSD